jgi:hypothetical protein
VKIIALLLLAATVYAQQDPQKETQPVVQIVTYWEPGDSHSYDLEMGTRMSLAAGETESFTSYRILVEVLEWTEKGYLIQWTYTNAAPPEGGNAFERRVVEINEGLSVRYYISDLGEFAGVENWQDIAAKARGDIESIRREFSGEPDIDKSLDTVAGAFESEEQFEKLAMEEVKFYHMLHGYSYLMNDPMVAEGVVENPFGGTPIQSKTTIELAEVDDERNTAYLVYTRTFEQTALERALFEALNGYLPDGELSSDQIAALPAFDMLIKKQFIFHTASGWLLEAYSERFSQAENETRTDSIYIEFLE